MRRLNWGDQDRGHELVCELADLFRGKPLTLEQVAQCYSIKHGKSVAQVLKDISHGDPMDLNQFLKENSEVFLVEDNKVSVKQAPKAQAALSPAVPTVRPGISLPSRTNLPPRNLAALCSSGKEREQARDRHDARDTRDSRDHRDRHHDRHDRERMSPPMRDPLRDMKERERDVRDSPDGSMKYSDVSRGIQNILKEAKAPLSIPELEKQFEVAFKMSIPTVVGSATDEYIQRKANIFTIDEETGKVALQAALLSGPPIADPSSSKDERFVVEEFKNLVEHTGPVCYISSLCGKFIQRNGISVTSIIGGRPNDLFKRHRDVFLLVGGGNVTLQRFRDHPEVQRLMNTTSSKSNRGPKPLDDLAPVMHSDDVGEADVVHEFVQLLEADESESVYISSLCGRFLQRFKKPVTTIIEGRPADFLRKYPELFVMTGGGNVGLRSRLGPDVESVPPPPPRKRDLIERPHVDPEDLEKVELTEALYEELHDRIVAEAHMEETSALAHELMEQMETASFLAVTSATMGGSLGKGLLTSRTSDVEVVLSVKQLPTQHHPAWLPPILETLQAVLEINLAEQGAQQFKVDQGRVTFVAGKERLKVSVKLCPVLDTHEEKLAAVKATPSSERHYYVAAFTAEVVDFIKSQPEHVKRAMRLVKWWGASQRWSSSFTTPSQYLLELIVLHASEQLKDKQPGLATLVKHSMDILRNLDNMKVLWADVGLAKYGLTDIAKPLLTQEPLVLDPINPYLNVADPACLDCRDLVEFAKDPACFHSFQMEALELSSQAHLRPASMQAHIDAEREEEERAA